MEVNQLVDFNILNNLPAPVTAYFKKTLHDGMPYISSAHITLCGQMKHDLNADWTLLRAEQHITAIKPGIVRNLKTRHYTETETFIAGTGDFYVWKYSFIKILCRKGQQTSQAQLLLWLAQSVWFPTTLLPNANLVWSPFSKYCARVTFRYRGINIFFNAYFNERDEIYMFESVRYFPNGKPEKWVVKFGNYEQINAVYVPTTVELSWIIKEVEHTYCKCSLNTVEYDTPEVLIAPNTTVSMHLNKKTKIAG